MENKIIFMRFIAIISILIHHALNIYQNIFINISIPTIDNYIFINTNILFKFVGLSVFTFISGYIMSLQLKKNPDLKFNDFILKKIRRVLIPCLFYGTLIFIFFKDYCLNNNPIDGSHLWYLPMLFCLFLLFPVYKLFKDKPIILLLINLLVFIVIFINQSSIRTFNDLGKYILIFYLGFVFFKMDIKNIKINKYLAFILLFALFSSFFLIPHLQFFNITINKIIYKIVTIAITINIYLLLNLLSISNIKIINLITYISNKSFEIYLIHYFIILIMISFIKYNIENSFYMIPLTFILSLILPIIIINITSIIKTSILLNYKRL